MTTEPMSESTLLIWDDEATLSFDPGIDDLRDRLIREGVLVPVEPDYEAWAQRIMEWTYEPMGETLLVDLLRELGTGIGGDE